MEKRLSCGIDINFDFNRILSNNASTILRIMSIHKIEYKLF